MTLLKQLETLATDSDLSSHFKTVRIRLTLFCFIILTILLIITGYSTFETSRISFENPRVVQPIDITVQQDIRQKVFEYNRQVRIENLEKLQTTIFAGHFFLIILLTIFAWISLYYLLKPISDTYKEKEEFLKHVTHEIRTPLAILKSDLQLSLQEKELNEIKKNNRSSLEEIDRLHNLASGFLNELSGEKPDIQMTEIYVKPMIEEIWQSLQSINTRKLNINITGDSYITKDHKDSLFHVVFNIIDNAVKYAKPGSTVSAHLDQSKKLILITNETASEKYQEGVGMEIIRKNVTNLDGTTKIKLEKNVFSITIKGI
jgi:signal transduction histidine kinase